MYSISEKKSKGKLLDISDINSFPMGSKDKVFKINNCKIRKIKVANKKLANPLVSKKVEKQYKKLIEYLTETLLDDDDNGETCREALNQIEKFRLIIKNKYRDFLKKQEMEKMSKQLLLLKKELEKKEIQIRDSYLQFMETNKRSK
ncbi:MAG: hypothetical protein IKE63_02865 [Bacilli bacterium]|nr:hypothetical protein [Bacilli bacterium]